MCVWLFEDYIKHISDSLIAISAEEPWFTVEGETSVLSFMTLIGRSFYIILFQT